MAWITTIKLNCYFTTTVDLDHIVDMRRHTDMAFIPKEKAYPHNLGRKVRTGNKGKRTPHRFDVLTRIFDSIMDLQGDFQVLEFTVGKRKSDPSYARLVVKGKSKEHLEHILEQVYREGAQSVSVEEVRLEPAPKDMVMPDDFYNTTNNATQVYYDSQWINVHNMMMDKCIVVDTRGNGAECKMVRDIVREDMIVVGEQGVKIIPQERPREGVDIFQFMKAAQGSSERPTQHVARKVASDIYNTRKEGRQDNHSVWTGACTLRRS